MNVVRTRAALRAAVTTARANGARLALVPTMGYLHEGHLSLVDLARAHGDVTAVSIFVNPIQFLPGEDLERYPRDEDRDLALLRERGVDLVFAPDAAEMYPHGQPAVFVHAPSLSDRLDGASRPGHFEGVLTVVAKLFNLFTPDAAVFGRKDLQQLVLVRRMVEDLDMGVRIVAGPIVRDTDGVALSSRNIYLSPSEREQARLLSAALREARAAFSSGERAANALLDRARRVLDRGPDVEIDYLEVVEPERLDRIDRADANCFIAVAAWVGRTRLIDNMRIGGKEGEAGG